MRFPLRHCRLVLGAIVMVAVLFGPPASAWADPADGITWTGRTSAADNNWRSVAYGNGVFVAVASSGSGNRVMTSPDGITWTARTSAANNNWTSVTYGNGVFVAVADSGTGNRVMTSPDGITWTIRTSADSTWQSVTYGNGLFVAVGTWGTDGSGTDRVMTSPDGITWTIRTAAWSTDWQLVTYGNGLFVALANWGWPSQVMTSPDGITWTTRASAANNSWRGVTYGNGLFVAVASSGSGNRVMTSPDGITWTSRTSAADNNWNAVTYGNGLFVAVATTGTGDRVMTSPDGITWTSRTSAANNSWMGVTYGSGVFVAVAQTGTGNRVMTNGTLDSTPPPLTIDSQPASVTNSTSASVAFSSTDGTATFTCRLDGGSYAACTSPHTVTGLSAGAHTIDVRATDPAGNTTVQTVSWTIDTTAPSLTITSRPPAQTNSTSATVAFSSTDGTASFTCRLDSGSYAACTSPHTVTGLSAGAHSTDVRATDPAGNTAVETVSWVVDVDAPGATAVLSGPAESAVLAGPASAAFVVSASDAAGGTGVAGYRCRLDGPSGEVGAWADCTSSHGYSALADGAYTFNVRAVDGAGLLGPITTRSWEVLSGVPDTRVDERVPAYLSAPGVTLRFSADQVDATFRCRVDNDAWNACTSPTTFALDEGAHSLLVRSVSRSGVTDPDPVVVTVVIDRTAPRTEIEQASVSAPTTTDPGFAARLRSNESGVRYECRLNTGAWGDCSDRPRYEGLPAGKQVFAARAIDRAGNVSTDPATRTWQLRGATRPLAITQLADPRALDCDSSQLTGVETIQYQWRRDQTPLKSTTDRHTITNADSGSRLTCTATVTFASGVTTRYTAPPILIDGKTRLTAFTATTTTKRRAPTATYTVNEDHLVLIRLWCRSTTHTCKAPSKPTDYQLPARASYTAAGLTKYRRIITHATKGTNHIVLNDVLPTGLPTGDYKLTIRLAQRTTTGRLTTTNFLHQDFRVGST